MANLVTLDEYKSFKGLNNPNDDAVHELIITAVSAYIKSYCGYTFVDYVSSDKTEYFDIWDPNVSSIFPNEFPIISVTSLSERANMSESYTALTTAAFEYVIQPDLDLIYRTSSAGLQSFLQGPQAVKLVYKAGYATLPEDLRLGIYDLISYYKRGDHVANRSVNASSMQLPAPDFNLLPKHIRRILDLYRML